MEQAAGCVGRYCQDGDPEAFARLVAEYRPTITAICRRYVVESADAEDAVQETFVKLARQAETITGEVGAWLSAVAATTALDYARRSLRERARRQRLAMERQVDRGMVPSWRALEMRLNEALEGLDPAMRSLVMARFFTGEAVMQIAKRSGVDSSTMSRRVTKAVARVRRALAAMGYGSLEETMLAGEEWETAGDQHELQGSRRERFEVAAPPMPEGKIRVGVLLSHQTSQLNLEGISGLPGGFRPAEKHQLEPAKSFHGEKYQLISLVEPGTDEYGPIEQGLRTYGIIGGMLDATDPEALKLLDVIVVGHAYAVTTRLLDAVTEAVMSGVGLYHEGQIGTEFPGARDPKICRLLQTDRVALFHTPVRHNLPVAATVVASHPILAGVPVGTGLQIAGCGPVYVPRGQESKVLIYKDDPVNPQDPPTAELNGLRMPALVVGKLGRGRTAMMGMRWSKPVQELPGLRGKFEHNVFDWLAEGRAAERRIWMAQSTAT